MKNQCLLILTVSLCVTSFKIFPIANRRLSVSWNVEPSEEPTTSVPTTIATSIATTETNNISTPSEVTDNFTNSAETLLIVTEVTAPEEINEATETIKTTDGGTSEKAKEEEQVDIEVRPELLTKTEEQTTGVISTVLEESTTVKPETIKTPPTVSITSTEAENTKAKVEPTAAQVITSASTPSDLAEATPLQPISIDLLPPKTEFLKYDFDPRYDDWNKVPLNFDAI